MNALSYAYIHHAPDLVKQAAIKQADPQLSGTTLGYNAATEQGRIPAALLLGLLGGGLGAGGAALLSKKNKTRNALIAGLLGALAGGAGGYYGAGLSTGLKLRNTSLDPTAGGQLAYSGNTWLADKYNGLLEALGGQRGIPGLIGLDPITHSDVGSLYGSPSRMNDALSSGDTDTPLTVGQMALGAINKLRSGGAPEVAGGAPEVAGGATPGAPKKNNRSTASVAAPLGGRLRPFRHGQSPEERKEHKEHQERVAKADKEFLDSLPRDTPGELLRDAATDSAKAILRFGLKPFLT